MEQIAEKKRLILESALERIKNYGFHDCPMSKVASNAGVASGTIYTYFSNKDELIIELFHYVKHLIHERVSQNDDPAQDYKQRFFNFWRSLKELYLEKPSIQRFFEHFMNSPYNTPELQTRKSEWHKWTDDFFEQGVQEGHLRPMNPKIIRIMVMGSVTSYTRFHTTYNTLISEEEQTDLHQIPEMIWDGIKRQETIN